MDDIFFSINGSNFGYNGKDVFATNQIGEDKIIKTFDNILLVKIIEQYAVFYLNDKNIYLKFDGQVFSDYPINESIEQYNELDFEIIPAHNEDLPQMPKIMWEQIRFKVDNNDLINNVGMKNDYHWGIDPVDLLLEKNSFLEGKFLIGICRCTCEGCDDIMVTVENIDNNIYWDVHHEVGCCPVEINHEYYVFNKDKYILKINQLKKRYYASY